MKSKIQEIIPVENRLDEELKNIKGGFSPSGASCLKGILCDSGLSEKDDLAPLEPIKPILK